MSDSAVAAVPRDGSEPPLRLLEKVSFASASMAGNLSWNLVGGFLILYYTDVALIPAAVVGTLVLATRIFDAIFDPMVGLLVDRTRTRFGKCRPYLLFASVPFGVMSVMVFAVPSDWSVNAKVVYAYITFGLLGLLYSFLYVPYGAMQPLLTSSRKDQLSVSGFRAMGTSISSIFVYSLALPATIYFGSGSRGYRGAAIVFAVCTVLLYLITFFNCRERVTGSVDSDRSPLRQAAPRMVRNPIWLIVVSFEILKFIRLGFFAAVMAFYARLVIGSALSVSVLLPTLSAGILLGGMIGPFYLKKMQKRRGMIWLLVFTIAVFALVPFLANKLIPFAIILFFGAVGNGIQAVMTYILVAEAVELQEARYGTRDAGLLSSMTAFNQKVGFAIGSALVAWALAYVGYKPDSPGSGAPAMLIGLMCGVPIVVAVLQIFLISQYRFDGAQIGRHDNSESPTS